MSHASGGFVVFFSLNCWCLATSNKSNPSSRFRLVCHCRLLNGNLTDFRGIFPESKYCRDVFGVGSRSGFLRCSWLWCKKDWVRDVTDRRADHCSGILSSKLKIEARFPDLLYDMHCWIVEYWDNKASACTCWSRDWWGAAAAVGFPWLASIVSFYMLFGFWNADNCIYRRLCLWAIIFPYLGWTLNNQREEDEMHSAKSSYMVSCLWWF